MSVKPTRRSAMRLSFAAATAAIVPVAVTAAPDPDATLIDICGRLVDVETELWLLPLHDEYAPEFGPNNARHEHLCGEQNRLLELLKGSPGATTLAGNAAMARAALTWVQRDHEGNALHDHWGDRMMLMLAESVAVGFVWPPSVGSCPMAHWAPKMTPDEIAKHEAAAEAANEARAQAYRETKARERAARRAEMGVGTVPAGRQELLGMDVDGSLYVWDTGNIQPITGLDDPGLYISGGHYLIWWKGNAVVVHLSSQADYKICVQFMCNSGPNLVMVRQEVEDIVVGKRLEDPKHEAEMSRLFDSINKSLHASQTSLKKQRGKAKA